jgi:hypothetical protein
MVHLHFRQHSGSNEDHGGHGKKKDRSHSAGAGGMADAVPLTQPSEPPSAASDNNTVVNTNANANANTNTNTNNISHNLSEDVVMQLANKANARVEERLIANPTQPEQAQAQRRMTLLPKLNVQKELRLPGAAS